MSLLSAPADGRAWLAGRTSLPRRRRSDARPRRRNVRLLRGLPRRQACSSGRTCLPAKGRRARPRQTRKPPRTTQAGEGGRMCHSAAGPPQTDTRRVCAGRCEPGRRYMLGDRNSLRAYDLASLLLHVGRRCRIRPNLRRCRNRGFQYLLQSCDIAGAAWTAPLPRPARALSQSCLKGSQLSGLQAPRSHAPSCSSSDGGADALRAAGHD